MRHRAFWAHAAAFAVFMLIASGASANDAVLAETLFREGRAASDAGDLTTACAKFAESYRLEPQPGTLLNLGDCEERRGRLATAWAHFNHLHDTLAPNDDRRPLARTRADAVASRLPRLRIALAKDVPAGAQVLRDGAPLDAAALGTFVPIDPGAHALVVRVAEHTDSTTDVKVAEGERKEITLGAGPLIPKPIAPPPPPPPPFLNGRRKLALAVAGGGVLAGVGGFVVGGIALATEGQSQSHCSGNVCVDQRGIDLHESAKTEALVADVLFAVGVAAVATGAVLWLTAKPSRVTVGLAPSAFVVGGVF